MTQFWIQVDNERLTTISHIDLENVKDFSCKGNFLKSLDFINPKE